MALLVVSDFTGNWRLPSGAGGDLQPAIDQAERKVLEDIFARETVDFILASPTQPPATTLLAGTSRVRSVRRLIPAVAGLVTLGVVGIGAQTAAVKGQAEPLAGRVWYEGRDELENYRREMEQEARQSWRWGGTVGVLSVTDISVTAPPNVLVWARPGTSVIVNATEGVVTAVTATAIEVSFSAAHAFFAGQQVQCRLNYKLRVREVWSM